MNWCKNEHILSNFNGLFCLLCSALDPLTHIWNWMVSQMWVRRTFFKNLYLGPSEVKVDLTRTSCNGEFTLQFENKKIRQNISFFLTPWRLQIEKIQVLCLRLEETHPSQSIFGFKSDLHGWLVCWYFP